MIGLCICCYNHNYGSMLQAYATIKVIEDLNENYEIIEYIKKPEIQIIPKMAQKLCCKIWWSEKKGVIQKKITALLDSDYREKLKLRSRRFEEFAEKITYEKKRVCHGYKELCDNAKRYECILTGSDQMWSPSGLTTMFYNLMFVPDDIRKVSYASSFGVDTIPKGQRKATKAFLERIEYLSVREMEGAAIVKELTGRDAFTALDPTLLLTKEEWDLFSGSERFVEEKYIFAYFLGDNLWHREFAQKLRCETGLKMVMLRHLDEYIKSDEKTEAEALYDVSPENFVNLVKNAEYILTDSFHGSVFSIIFNKSFLTFERYKKGGGVSKNSRIASLLRISGLEERLCSYCDDTKRMFEEIDYIKAEAALKKKAEESRMFLKGALNG